MKKICSILLVLAACTSEPEQNFADGSKLEEAARIQSCLCTPCFQTTFYLTGHGTQIITQSVEYLTTVTTLPLNVVNLNTTGTYRIHNTGSAIYTVKITGGGPELNATVPAGNYYQYTRASVPPAQCGGTGYFPEHQVKWKRLTCGYPGQNNMNMAVQLMSTAPQNHIIGPSTPIGPGLHIGISYCPPGF